MVFEKKIISNGILQVKIWTMRLSIKNEFDRNFWARRVPFALSKYEKRVSRQKIKENRSLNRFPTILPSYFRCLKVSLGTTPSNVVFNFGVYHPPLGRPGVGKRFFCEVPRVGSYIQMKSPPWGSKLKWSPDHRDENTSEVPRLPEGGMVDAKIECHISEIFFRNFIFRK